MHGPLKWNNGKETFEVFFKALKKATTKGRPGAHVHLKKDGNVVSAFTFVFPKVSKRTIEEEILDALDRRFKRKTLEGIWTRS